MRFWFDRGVDGFRIDVLWHMVKAADFPTTRSTRYRPAMGDVHRVLRAPVRPTSPKCTPSRPTCVPSRTVVAPRDGASAS